MTRLEILKAARELIADPARWTKGSYAVTENGMYCDHHAPEAKAFCSLGACHRVAPPTSRTSYREWSGAFRVLNDTAMREFGLCTVQLNDHPNTTHEDIIHLFDEAIRAVSK